MYVAIAMINVGIYSLSTEAKCTVSSTYPLQSRERLLIMTIPLGTVHTAYHIRRSPFLTPTPLNQTRSAGTIYLPSQAKLLTSKTNQQDNVTAPQCEVSKQAIKQASNQASR